jgi:hypothetical protein
MSGLSTQDVYVDGKLVVPKRFHKDRQIKKGLVWDGSWEHRCTKMYMIKKASEYYAANRDHYKAVSQKKYSENKDHFNERKRKSYHKTHQNL